MPSPTLGEIAYLAYAQVQPTPQPLYKALPYAERLGWSVGVHAAVVAVVAPDLCPDAPTPPIPFLDAIEALRQRVKDRIQAQGLSMKQAGQQSGVDRQILTRWLAGEENVAVRTLLTLAAWFS